MKLFIVRTFCFFVLCSCGIRIQSIAVGYDRPVQVIDDKVNKRYLIPNYGADKAKGKGRIFQRSYKGETSIFVDGLTNPLGGVIVDTVLYVSNDSTNVLGYGLKSGKEVFRIKISESKQLVSLASDGKGHIYATDFWGTNVFKVDVRSNTYEIVCDLGFIHASGLVYDKSKNRLVFITMMQSSKIYAISLRDRKVKLLYDTHLESCDGLAMDKNGYFYSGSWKTGSIYRFSLKAGDASHNAIISGIETPVYSFVDISKGVIAIPSWNSNAIYYSSLPPADDNRCRKIESLLIEKWIVNKQ